MNCKPDDIAQVVRIGSDPCMRHWLGVTVQVKMPIFLSDGVSWTYDGDPKRCRGCNDCISTLPDDALQPLKGKEGEHPGDVVRKSSEEKTHPRMRPAVWLSANDFKGL